MKRLIVLGSLTVAVILMASHGIAGPMTGDDAKSQFGSWVSTYGGTFLNFDELSAGTQLDNQYATKGVRFKSIRDPNGSSISKPVVVISYGGSMEISGEPSWGTGSDGRAAYEIRFDQPQRWAGIVRHWDNYSTITKFYNPSGILIYSFHKIQQTHGWTKIFLGYLAESNDTSQWISRIECDGEEIDTTAGRMVGYSDDLHFGTASPCSYAIFPTNNSFTSQGGSGSVSVTAGAGCAWTGSVDSGSSAWVSITSGTSGTGNGTVNYSVQANSTSSARTGTLTIADKTFTITQQAAAACTYSISPTSNSFTSEGGSGSVSVTAGSGCSWTASVDSGSSAWVSITSGMSGTGNGTVNYSVQANSTSSARTGTLAIAGRTFTVTQQAAGGGCNYAIYPPDDTFGKEAGTGNVSVAASPGCSWTAQTDSGSSDWLAITSGASGTENGKVNYSVQANNTGKTRAGKLTIGGQSFTVTQQSTPTVNVGDINGDGDITSVDAAMVLQIANGLITPTAVQTSAADGDRDGKVTASDAQMILYWAAQGLGVKPPRILTEVIELPVLETREATIGNQGGQVSLPSGVTLSIPAGQMDKTRQIELMKLDPTEMGDIGNEVFYEIIPDVSYFSGSSLSVPLSAVLIPGESASNIEGTGIFYFNPLTRMNELKAVPYTINGNSLTVSLSQVRDGATGSPDQGQFVVLISKSYKSKTAQDRSIIGGSYSKILKVPYFEQGYAGYCWATCLAMKLNYAMGSDRLYSGEKPQDIIDYMKNGQGEGLRGWWIPFSPSLRKYIFTRAGVLGTVTAWPFSDWLKHYLIDEIELERPVMLLLGSETHVVVVTGYEENNGKITFWLNDPANGVTPRDWDDIYAEWKSKGWNWYYLTVLIDSNKKAPPALTVNVMHELTDDLGNRDPGLVFSSPMSKKAPFDEGNIRFTWYDPKTTEEGFISDDGYGVGVRAIPQYYSMELNLRVADTRSSGNQALVARTMIEDASGGRALDVPKDLSTVRNNVLPVLVKEDLPPMIFGNYVLSVDLLDGNTKLDTLKIPITFDMGIYLTATLSNDKTKVVLKWNQGYYLDDFDRYEIYRVGSKNPGAHRWTLVDKVFKDPQKREIDLYQYDDEWDNSINNSYSYAIVVRKGSNVLITSNVAEVGTSPFLSGFKTSGIGVTWHVLFETTTPNGSKFTSNSDTAEFGSGWGYNKAGQFIGQTFEQRADYVLKGPPFDQEYHTVISVTIDGDSPDGANGTKVTKVTHFTFYEKTLYAGTTTETEFTGDNIPLWIIQDSSGTTTMSFKVDGAGTCEKVLPGSLKYSQRSVSSEGKVTETKLKGLPDCNSHSHVNVVFSTFFQGY